MTALAALLRGHARADVVASRAPGCVGLNCAPKDHLSWRAAEAIDAAETALLAARDGIDRALAELRAKTSGAAS